MNLGEAIRRHSRASVWAGFFLLVLACGGAMAWRSRPPEHWPQNPVAWWTGNTNWHEPESVMRPAFFGLAEVRKVDGDPAYVLEQSAFVSLGRWHQTVEGWSCAFWVRVDPKNPGTNSATPSTLLQIREAVFKLQLRWDEHHLHASLGQAHHYTPFHDFDWPPVDFIVPVVDPLPAFQWVHVTLTQDRWSLRVYLNGRIAGQCGLSDTHVAQNAAVDLGPIGRSPDHFIYDDIVVFRRLLNEAEIGALADAKRGTLPRLYRRSSEAAHSQSSIGQWIFGGLVLLIALGSALGARHLIEPLVLAIPKPAYRPMWSILSLELGATVVISLLLKTEAARSDRVQFEELTRRFADQIRENFLRIGDLTNSARDWAATRTNLTQADWEQWTHSRSAAHEFPGLLGLGFAEPVYPDEVPQHEHHWSTNHGFPYRIWDGLTNQVVRRPDRFVGGPRLPVVVYSPWSLDPERWKTNHTILGRDLLAMSETTARNGIKPEPERIEDAVGNGNLTSSGVVEIAPVGWYGREIKGIRVYSPLVTEQVGDMLPLQRRVWSKGMAFASIDVERWLKEQLASSPVLVGFQISTGESKENRHELFFNGSKLMPQATYRPDAYLTTTREIRVFYYRLWVDFCTSPQFEAQSRRYWQWVSAGLGTGFTLLTAGLLFIQIRGREKDALNAERLQKANGELARNQREKERLSRNLHDGTIQSLYAVGLHLQYAERHLDHSDARAAHGVEESQRLVQETIVELREFLLSLKAESADRRTFLETIEPLVSRLRRTTPVEMILAVTAESGELASSVTVQLVHFTREAVSNALRHGNAERLQIALWFQSAVLNQDSGASPSRLWVLEITDNGIGFDPATIHSAGFGMLTMRERASELGGTLTVNSAPGKGTTIRLEFTTAVGGNLEESGLAT